MQGAGTVYPQLLSFELDTSHASAAEDLFLTDPLADNVIVDSLQVRRPTASNVFTRRCKSVTEKNEKRKKRGRNFEKSV